MKPIVFLVLIVLVVVGIHHVLAREGPAELIPSLKHEDLAVRFEAGYALASLGAEARSAVPALIEMLSGDDHDNAEIATLVLARISPDPAIEPAVPLLIETVQGLEKGWTAQMNAAVALLRLGREEEKARAVVRDELYLSLMLPLLKDKQPVNRLHVCEILMFAGLPRQDILDLLRKTAAEDAEARVREAAAEALRKIGPGR
jgi:HEAT repeat protein